MDIDDEDSDTFGDGSVPAEKLAVDTADIVARAWLRSGWKTADLPVIVVSSPGNACSGCSGIE